MPAQTLLLWAEKLHNRKQDQQPYKPCWPQSPRYRYAADPTKGEYHPPKNRTCEHWQGSSLRDRLVQPGQTVEDAQSAPLQDNHLHQKGGHAHPVSYSLSLLLRNPPEQGLPLILLWSR